MAKKTLQHGRLYEHAKRELEAAGVTLGKGNMDQKLSGTVLKLIDIFEHNTPSELLRGTVRTLFTTLSNGETLAPPTDVPEEWKLARDQKGDYLVLRRDTNYKSFDGGVSWVHPSGASGMSIHVEEEIEDGPVEKQEGV